MVAARLAKMEHGGDRRSDQPANLPLGPTQAEAAQLLNVSERSVNTVFFCRLYRSDQTANLPVSTGE